MTNEIKFNKCAISGCYLKKIEDIDEFTYRAQCQKCNKIYKLTNKGKML